MSPQQYATEVMNLVEKSLEPAASPHRLPQSKEELIEQNRRIAVERLKETIEHLPGIQNWLVDVRDLLDLPGVLDGSTAVQCFALLYKIRKALQAIDGLIGDEIDGQTKDRKPGRLQDVIQRYGEATNRTHFGRVEGLTIFQAHFLSAWVKNENVAEFERNEELAYLVERKPVVNSSRLTAVVRERLQLATDDGQIITDAKEVLPEEVRNVVGVIDTYNIKAKKG